MVVLADRGEVKFDDNTAKEGPVRIEYKCLIWNLIYSQTKYVIDYKDYLFPFMICNFPNWKFVC